MSESRIVLHFPKTLLDRPVISKAVQHYNLSFNILRADITQEQEGLMVLGLEGEQDDIDAAVEWMREQGVRVQPLEKDVVRDDERCTHCGACVVICPTDALAMDLQTREVAFDAAQCVACGLCVPVCPPRAMSIHF
ncbi:MAG: 4Fe-4S binding protein [candidate division WS1 bacterium]|jgi:ferredoxin|nr:4Fe-4S binding protein [candidate division WS1 bacterium]